MGPRAVETCGEAYRFEDTAVKKRGRGDYASHVVGERIGWANVAQTGAKGAVGEMGARGARGASGSTSASVSATRARGQNSGASSTQRFGASLISSEALHSGPPATDCKVVRVHISAPVYRDSHHTANTSLRPQRHRPQSQGQSEFAFVSTSGNARLPDRSGRQVF